MCAHMHVAWDIHDGKLGANFWRWNIASPQLRKQSTVEQHAAVAGGALTQPEHKLLAKSLKKPKTTNDRRRGQEANRRILQHREKLALRHSATRPLREKPKPAGPNTAEQDSSPMTPPQPPLPPPKETPNGPKRAFSATGVHAMANWPKQQKASTAGPTMPVREKPAVRALGLGAAYASPHEAGFADFCTECNSPLATQEDGQWMPCQLYWPCPGCGNKQCTNRTPHCWCAKAAHGCSECGIYNSNPDEYSDGRSNALLCM